MSYIHYCNEKRTSLEIYIRRTVEMRRSRVCTYIITIYLIIMTGRLQSKRRYTNDMTIYTVQYYSNLLTIVYRMLQCLHYNAIYSDIYIYIRRTESANSDGILYIFYTFLRMSSGRKQFAGRRLSVVTRRAHLRYLCNLSTTNNAHSSHILLSDLNLCTYTAALYICIYNKLKILHNNNVY